MGKGGKWRGEEEEERRRKEEGGKIEVWRKGRRNGESDRERPGKGGEERKSRRECKSESDIGGNYTILMNRLVYYNVMFIQILYESYINCQYKHVCESPLT